MKLEYLLLNLLIISGPLILSFDKKVRYSRRWRDAIPAIIIVMVPFIIWDAVVTGRHWWFNEKYITGIKMAGLPIEEWLFFITVPFAVLFVWEIFSHYSGNPISSRLSFIKYLLMILLLPGIGLLAQGKEYTGLAVIALAICGFIDLLLKQEILARKNTYFYLAIVTALNVIFNGYLTGRPIVLYGEAYQLGIRILTIPMEDFLYGYSLIIFNTILFEKFKRREDHG